MPITQLQKQNARINQHNAAHDPNNAIRLVAGPGSGKSFSIQERVLWLLQKGINPDHIHVISFTRKSVRDLQDRIIEYCVKNDQLNARLVRITTLHSLALRTLKSAGLLFYPVDPLVIDEWEIKNIIDTEFSISSGFQKGKKGAVISISRAQDIRRDYEAFCHTGKYNPPNFVLPNPPISQNERNAYISYNNLRTQIYSCVLPGEIVRQCVKYKDSGVLDPGALLKIQYLILDEYQDFNPSDLDFVECLINSGIKTFIAGDDDQSIYSFRYASPKGIQTFIAQHPTASDHELKDCFRCTTKILEAGQTLISAFSETSRIPKSLKSLYCDSEPPVNGVVHLWNFLQDYHEANAIALSISNLLESGIPPDEIMILISNSRIQLPPLTSALQAAGVAFESPRHEKYIDSKSGRFLYALLRIICNKNDYVAHRIILGSRPRVGPRICNSIAESIIAHNLNYRDIFYKSLPTDLFTKIQLTQINKARSLVLLIEDWQSTDTLDMRENEILGIISEIFDEQSGMDWLSQINNLPQDMSIEETREYLGADTNEQKKRILESVYIRLETPPPEEDLIKKQVRLMTMHSAKGLSAQIVFIPGLEELVIPGSNRNLYPGLILESARMLYVSITRARAACIISKASKRFVYGTLVNSIPSRFAGYLGGSFIQQKDAMGLTTTEIEQIQQVCSNL